MEHKGIPGGWVGDRCPLKVGGRQEVGGWAACLLHSYFATHFREIKVRWRRSAAALSMPFCPAHLNVALPTAAAFVQALPTPPVLSPPPCPSPLPHLHTPVGRDAAQGALPGPGRPRRHRHSRCTETDGARKPLNRPRWGGHSLRPHFLVGPTEDCAPKSSPPTEMS